ncbi:MAG: type IV secretion system protein [Mesorhizobium sp.]|nr:type IV secretion system protein [Mesorhizobium sp.]MCO5164608.1 type IV secretion system protein [Mesorhizobium sp.]
MVEETVHQGLRSYYQDGDRWEYEIYKKARRSRAFAWVVAFACMGMTILSLATLVLLVPLKTFEPYIVEVDRTTGFLEVKSGLTQPVTLTDRDAVTMANVVRFVVARETYDPFRVTENSGLARLLSTGAAANEIERLYSRTNPNNPTRIYGTRTTIEVKIKSVTFPNPSTALVRFWTEEKSDTDVITRHYISVLRYRYTSEPIRMEWRFENPLGFQITNYRRDQETVGAGGQ